MVDSAKQIKKIIDWRQMTDWVIEQGKAIQQIPAPTFQEGQRAEYVQQQFRQLGLKDIEVDERYNVYGRCPGQRSEPGIMILAHTDTVFPAETDLTLRRKGNRLYGPGLGDNSMGVAGLLGLAEVLRGQAIQPGRDLWFVASSREEGLGDLGGIKVAFQRLQGQIEAVINLEGLAFGHIYHAGIAVRRLHITAHAEGGHSWIHYGRASAVHGIVQLGARITAIQTVEQPRTTYNIGMIEGGQSINTIASQAGLWLDMRSEDHDVVMDLEKQVQAIIQELTTNDLRFEVEVVGERPAGAIPESHPLVQLAVETLGQLGLRAVLETGSTDGNVPLAAGCPTVTIGITRGGNAHRLDEFIETEPVTKGLQQLVMLALAASKDHHD